MNVKNLKKHNGWSNWDTNEVFNLCQEVSLPAKLTTKQFRADSIEYLNDLYDDMGIEDDMRVNYDAVNWFEVLNSLRDLQC